LHAQDRWRDLVDLGSRRLLFLFDFT
jgi:hypothetical protein